MNCKYCGKLVEQAIEGEITCPNCWSLSQMDAEDRQIYLDIQAYRRQESRQNKKAGHYARKD